MPQCSYEQTESAWRKGVERESADAVGCRGSVRRPGIIAGYYRQYRKVGQRAAGLR